MALFECINVMLIINSNYHFLPNVSEAKQVALNVLSYFELEDEDMLQSREGSRMLTEGIRLGAVEFRNISFAYETRGNKVFNRFNLKLA